jgi:glutathione S-transferase
MVGISEMKLYYTPLKGLIHKVQVVAIEKGLYDSIEARPCIPYEQWDELTTANPLSKVPTLVLDNGTSIYGGHVIYEYFDSLKPEPQLFPRDGAARWTELTRLTLGDQLFDLSSQRQFEINRPDDHIRSEYRDRIEAAIKRGLDRVNADCAYYAGLTVGQISIACALKYHDWQHERGILPWDWRDERPAMLAWYDRFTDRPSFVPRDDEIVDRPILPIKDRG